MATPDVPFRAIANSIRCRLATTGAVTVASALVPGQTLDGKVLVAGDLVLVKNETTASASKNGIYTSQVVPNRYEDYNDAVGGSIRGSVGAYDTHAGLSVQIEDGTANIGTEWVCTSPRGGTLGTTALTFVAKAASLGLVVGSTVQPWDAQLDTLAALSATQVGRIVLGIPVGTVVDYAGTAAPSQWLMCYGQLINRTTYADLFTAIGTTYDVGDASTTFGVPDARGRVIAGQDDMGGSSANRLTGLSGGVDGDVLGATGGEETHVTLAAEMAAHAHFLLGAVNNSDGSPTPPSAAQYIAQKNASGGNDAYTTSNTATAATVGLSSSIGSGTAHNNVPPVIVLNKIIYAGV